MIVLDLFLVLFNFDDVDIRTSYFYFDSVFVFLSPLVSKTDKSAVHICYSEFLDSRRSYFKVAFTHVLFQVFHSRTYLKLLITELSHFLILYKQKYPLLRF